MEKKVYTDDDGCGNGVGRFYCRANPQEASPAAAQMFYRQNVSARAPGNGAQEFYEQRELARGIAGDAAVIHFQVFQAVKCAA